MLLAMPGVQLLDVAGPLDVFAEANAQTGRAAYRLEVAAAAPGAVVTSSGARLIADRVAGAGTAGDPVDTLLVAGCPKMPDTTPPRRVVDWVRREAPRARRFGSVCSGAFLLAQAGLLDGRRVTTHWAVAARLAAAFPAVTVDSDAIHVRDGRLRTAAGVTAGLDLALALVEEDLGRDTAKQVAAQLVMFFKRPGGQLQFSRDGASLPSGRAILQEVQRYVAANPAAHHDVGSLAARTGLSPRHFARLFRSETGGTPADWVESARVAAARRLLEESRAAPKQVAAQCGFANADTLRRAFQRHVGVTPAAYRRQFRPDA
ncbi:GlxA family transcriptional regulator [Acidisphaera rubrifaciens]|uniref:Transcriptional regulator AraC n=1 Tax=Acidisphaera rubrifaciens HS-AP3 TaxID=1231350 RepID=A0A0D6P9Y8_9PROT|nr:helix-turn-helix domain-containing protein [Acidisphaera rubrifaciens]GAN78482.1 transcriptional regulator AraC [Acidisphaera rubrifaciens HS-AP3]